MRILVFSRLAFLAALLHGLAIAPAHADFSFNFNNASDAGLTHYDPLAPFGSGATYSFPVLGTGNDGYRLTSGPSASVSSLGPARVGSYQAGQSFGDFRLSVDILGWDPQLSQGFGLGARLSSIGLGTSNGYFLHYNPLTNNGLSYLVIDRIDAEQSNTVNQAFVTLNPLNPATGFRMIFTGIGSTLTGQVFALNNPSLMLASVTFVDSSYQSGLTGVLVAGFQTPGEPNTRLDVTFDNLQASSVPEPSSLALCGMAGIVGLGIARFRRGRAKAA